jgi:hypothetical protein
MIKGLGKTLFILFPIVGIILFFVLTKMTTHEAKMDETKLRMERSMAVDELSFADNPKVKKELQARIKEIDEELKDAKERKVAARKAEDSALKDFKDSAEEFSKKVEQDGPDGKELNQLNKSLDKEFK